MPAVLWYSRVLLLSTLVCICVSCWPGSITNVCADFWSVSGTYWPVCATSLASVFAWGCMFLPVCANFAQGLCQLLARGCVTFWPVFLHCCVTLAKICDSASFWPCLRRSQEISLYLFTVVCALQGCIYRGYPNDFGSFVKFSVNSVKSWSIR